MGEEFKCSEQIKFGNLWESLFPFMILQNGQILGEGSFLPIRNLKSNRSKIMFEKLLTTILEK